MNYSQQREVILDCLKQTKSHPTAHEIYLHVQKKLPKISQGTVYRNLAMLAENGQILKLDDHTGNYRYDGDISMHAHFKCTQCGKFQDLFPAALSQIANTIEKQYICKIKTGQLVFQGICSDCLTKEEHE